MKKQYQQYREHLLEELMRGGGGGGATSAAQGRGAVNAFGHFAPLEAGQQEQERRLAARRTSLLAVLLASAILGAFICYLVRRVRLAPNAADAPRLIVSEASSRICWLEVPWHSRCDICKATIEVLLEQGSIIPAEAVAFHILPSQPQHMRSYKSPPGDQEPR